MAEDRKSFVIKESENGGVNITDEVVQSSQDLLLQRWKVYLLWLEI